MVQIPVWYVDPHLYHKEDRKLYKRKVPRHL